MAYRDRSKSRDRSFLPSASVSAERSGTPSPDHSGRRSPLDEPIESLTHKFMHLGSHGGPLPSPISSRAANLGGTDQVGESQRFSENGCPEDFSYGNQGTTLLTSDLTSASNWKGPISWPNDQGTGRENLFSPSQAASYSALGSLQTPETVAPLKSTGMLSSSHMNIEGKSGNQDDEHFPLFNNDFDEMATDITSTRSLNYKTTTSRQREKSLPRNQETKTTYTNFQTISKIINDNEPEVAFVNSEDRKKTFWTGQSVHNAPNDSSKITYEATDVDNTGATGFGLKSAVKGDKDVLCSGSQSLRSHVLLTPVEPAAPPQVSTLLKMSLSTPSSGNRATVSEALGQHSAQISVTSASEFARRAPGCALSKSLKDRSDPMSVAQQLWLMVSLWVFPSNY